MKAVIKIIACYCIWFGFTLWLSFWFMLPAGWIEGKLLPTKTPAGVEFAVMLILWSGFVCLLALLPILWMRKRRLEIARRTARNVMFIILLMGCTIFCTFAWDKCVADKLYNCTDAIGFDFLHPGDWIHGNYVAVPEIVTGRSMSEPDTIKEGWSIPELWCLWWSFVAASVAISASLTFLIFHRRKSNASQTISQ
jgi:hypothetical protein